MRNVSVQKWIFIPIVLIFLESWKVESIDIENKSEDEQLCIICMQKFDESDIIKKCDSKCAANFHESCYNECILRNIRCPHCHRINTRFIPNTEIQYLNDELESEPLIFPWTDEAAHYRSICNEIGTIMIICFFILYIIAVPIIWINTAVY